MIQATPLGPLSWTSLLTTERPSLPLESASSLVRPLSALESSPSLLRLKPSPSSCLKVGLHLGRSNTPGLTPFHHALGTDFAVWNSYNDLARGQGVGIGFAHGNWDRNGWWGWLGVVGAGAANRLARVPT